MRVSSSMSFCLHQRLFSSEGSRISDVWRRLMLFTGLQHTVTAPLERKIGRDSPFSSADHRCGPPSTQALQSAGLQARSSRLVPQMGHDGWPISGFSAQF